MPNTARRAARHPTSGDDDAELVSVGSALRDIVKAPIIRWAIVAAMVAGSEGCAQQLGAVGQALVTGAVTVEQHDALARDFEEKANDAQSLAAYHLALAAKYRSSKMDVGEDAPAMVAHCEALAEDYARAAAHYHALAAVHSGHSNAPNRVQHFQKGDDRSVQDRAF